MQKAYRYKAFISYSHADQKWAQWLHRSLEGYRVSAHLKGRQTPAGPVPARLTPVFRDREELASSPDLSDRIRQALDDSQFLIVICSPNAARSRWVNREIEHFKWKGRSNHILCIIVDGNPSTPGADDDCFPPVLRQRFDESGNRVDGTSEPIASDLREDGKLQGRLKLIAGLLGVGLDELRRRELQRRNRRMVTITASSALIAALTVILAVNALLARNEADQRRRQAEALLTFMVGDLRTSLTPIGRLDLLEKVGQQAMEYFAATDVGNLTDSELLSQAQVLTQLGEIRIGQLQYRQALDSFTEAYERSAALFANDPADGERMYNRGQAEFWVGFVHWRIGNLSDAQRWLDRYLSSAEGLIVLDPDREDWIREVAYGHHNLAVLNQEVGELDAAVRGFELEMQILEALYAKSPSGQYRRDIADAQSYLGNIALMRGDIAGALDQYERSADTIRSLTGSDSGNAAWIDDLAFAVQLLGATTAMTGDLEGAADYANEAAKLFESLTARDATNLNWQRASTKPQITLGQIQAALLEWNGALAQITSVITLLESLIEADNSDLNVLTDYAKALTLRAWIEYSTDNDEQAELTLTAAIENLGDIERTDRLNDERLGLLAFAHVLRSDTRARIGRAEDAFADNQRAYDLLIGRASNTRCPFLLDPWARVLLQSKRRGEGLAVIDVLTELGYRPLFSWPD